MALEGKTAVVSGAAMGIGKAVSEILLENGAKVALLDINEAAAESLLETLRKKHGAGKSLFVKCDVESEEQIKAAFQKTVETFGGIDIVCNNAGILTESNWKKTISINLLSVIKATYIALEHMSKLSGGQGGIIINTASMAGLGPFSCCPVYTAAKFGVVGFTRAMAGASEELGYGIRFNAVCPGFVQTDLLLKIPDGLGQFQALGESLEQMKEKMGVLSTSEVAEAFLELAKDETKNGQAILVMPKQRSYVNFASLVSKE
ncbi:15-hydroxyprostaglandin dehydrogenase [NAD(+)] [Nematolebias whitei]|uniref:15-hydroxyprostaglandin dehydrogenase [NAD(+)] n=1 Tax=Nematolebias whitei TaxID=451745 RepID=UPI00189BEF39|nr:15-hydroxyprostaglandin dehydrogenase [NAD(+)] [Nematolebias whitei]